MNNAVLQGAEVGMSPAVLYRTQSIEITNSRILVQTTSTYRTAYAIQHVASVGARKEDANILFPAILVLGGIAMCIGGLTTTLRTEAITILVIGVAMLAVGIWIWYSTKPTFSVLLSMSSGDKVTLAAEDQATAEAIETATLQAIAAVQN